MVPIDNGIDWQALIDFGRRAKQEVLSKVLACDLAGELGIHLSEHGGTGDGVVGALAGIGLRLSGNDGRFRGWGRFGPAGSVTTVQTLCSERYIDGVQTVDGGTLGPDTRIVLGADRVKTMLSHNRRVVLATRNASADGTDTPAWRTLTRQEIKRY